MAKRYHFIGIGGIGMSALARILLDKQVAVSGSDLVASGNTAALSERGATIREGHASEHVLEGDVVVYSSGVQPSNPEYQAAEALKCQLLHRSQLLAELMQGHRRFVCTGTHGKTTTTALLAHVLMSAKLDPSFAVGGLLGGVNGRARSGEFFVAEGDESDGSFLDYEPEGAIVTNIEPEHMDYFKDEATLHAAFDQFFGQVEQKELCFYCGDDRVLEKIASGRGVRYGFSSGCDLRLSNYTQKGWESRFTCTFEGKTYDDIRVALPGEHNALNAAAVLGLALRLNVPEEAIRGALATFPGVARRLQKRGEQRGVLYLDDYAHHPTEIAKTVSAVKRAVGERRLIVLYQPHRYTRTRDTLGAIEDAFEGADHVYITDIYSAGEAPIEGVTPQALIEKSKTPTSYVAKGEWDAIPLQPHDVFLSLGAGDITSVHAHPPRARKLKIGLIFGGASCEHEISLCSALFVAGALDPSLYDVRYFGIDKRGRWVRDAETILVTQKVVPSTKSLPLSEVMKDLERCDVLAPILHGTHGEDGTIQGFFEMLGKPYVGPDHRSAALAMDKVLSKRVVASAGVPTPHDVAFHASEWRERRDDLIAQVKKFPVFVKPVQLGSSVGVTRVTDVADLAAAVERALEFDHKVMIEEALDGCREIEFAVMGNQNPVAPPPGEMLGGGTFIDYERKYGARSVEASVNPELSPKLIAKGQELALRAYKAVGCTGMTRIDFLLDSEGNFWFFEMNGIPGLRALSLYPKVWLREGMTPHGFINQLIILALERRRLENRHFRCLEQS